MSLSSVYIETTVIGYYTARRTRDIVTAAHQEITREWWDVTLPKLQPYISQVVIDEVSRGDESAAADRTAAVEGFFVLEVTPEVVALAEEYFAVLDIPEKAKNDSLHLATAVMHGIDYLVSWNCTHIAAARVRGVVDELNDEHGYATPVICTPEELMEV